MISKPEDWKPGRYQWDRSFLWNLVHYKKVNYARFTRTGETDKIQSVLQARLLLIVFGAYLALCALKLFTGV